MQKGTDSKGYTTVIFEDGTSIRARYVIGADGSQSVVRATITAGARIVDLYLDARRFASKQESILETQTVIVTRLELLHRWSSATSLSLSHLQLRAITSCSVVRP